MAESRGNTNHAQGYDFEVVGGLPDHYTCLVCLSLIRKNAELPCGHVYCEYCLKRWERKEIEKDENGQVVEVRKPKPLKPNEHGEDQEDDDCVEYFSFILLLNMPYLKPIEKSFFNVAYPRIPRRELEISLGVGKILKINPF